jgi:hypothetical protein
MQIFSRDNQTSIPEISSRLCGFRHAYPTAERGLKMSAAAEISSQLKPNILAKCIFVTLIALMFFALHIDVRPQVLLEETIVQGVVAAMHSRGILHSNWNFVILTTALTGTKLVEFSNLSSVGHYNCKLHNTAGES